MGAAFTERDRDLSDNAAIGAVAGLVLGGVGSGAVTRPLSLDHSLRLALQKLGTKFVSLRHYGRYEARLLFETKSGFQVAVATATADSSRQWSQEDLEDWLYQQLVLGVISKLGENA